MFHVYLSLQGSTVPFVASAKTQIKSHNQQERTHTLKRRRIPEQSRRRKKNPHYQKFSEIQIENGKNKYHESKNFEIKLKYQQATKMIFAEIK